MESMQLLQRPLKVRFLLKGSLRLTERDPIRVLCLRGLNNFNRVWGSFMVSL